MESRALSDMHSSYKAYSIRIYRDLAACRSITYSFTPYRVSASMGDFFEIALPATRKPHIGIIGAGVSGLRCADVLLSQGFEVTIIEARDRVGGRMHQVNIPGTEHLVDTGPNWIHGTEDNPILDIARQTNTVTHRWDENSQIFDENGEFLSEKEGDEYNEIFWKIIVDAFKYSNEVNIIPSSRSLLDYFETKVAALIADSQKDSERRQKILLQMSERWGAFVGSPIARQSLKFFWLEECIEGENLFCAGTYKRILDRISKPVVETAEMKLSTKVIKVTTSEEKVGKVTLSTSRGESIVCDEVVVTVPLGWLQKNLAVFDPPLPVRLCQAIVSIGYGSLEKVYISFPQAFWLHDDSSDRSRCLSSCNYKNGHTGFTQWLPPTYPKHNSNYWAQDAVDLSTLPDPCGHPTLLFYIFGDQSKTMTATIGKLSSAESKHIFLSTYFKPYYSLLPHYDPSNTSCEPVASYATNWCADELAGYGSYSNFQIGLEEGDKDIEIMREGCPELGIWFAGEHTSAFVASGTVTGAYWSGEAVGKRIASMYGIEEELHVKWKGQEGHVKDEAHVDKEINIRGFTDESLQRDKLGTLTAEEAGGVKCEVEDCKPRAK